jgi:hypothetical protein
MIVLQMFKLTGIKILPKYDGDDSEREHRSERDESFSTVVGVGNRFDGRDSCQVPRQDLETVELKENELRRINKPSQSSLGNHDDDGIQGRSYRRGEKHPEREVSSQPRAQARGKFDVSGSHGAHQVEREHNKKAGQATLSTEVKSIQAFGRRVISQPGKQEWNRDRVGNAKSREVDASSQDAYANGNNEWKVGLNAHIYSQYGI